MEMYHGGVAGVAEIETVTLSPTTRPKSYLRGAKGMF